MTGFNHGLTGAAIALTVKNPLLAVPLAFISHFIQDAIPHWDYGTRQDPTKLLTKQFNRFLMSDFLLAVIIMIVLAIIFPAHKWLIWTCMIAAASPDLAWAYYRLYVEKIKKQKKNWDPLSRLHLFLEWSETPKGAIVEVAWFFLAIYVVLKLR
jgi:hypothetical protein